MRRATIYMANRAFPEAREHWQALIDNYPNDANVPAAIFGIAVRSVGVVGVVDAV